jgi:hypothetical protein
MWYKLLLPSWDFFRKPGHSGALEVRLQSKAWDSSWTRWPKPVLNRRWWHLLLNSSGNTYHWRHQKLNHLLELSQTGIEFERLRVSVPYMAIEEEIMEQTRDSAVHAVQFRLLAVPFDSTQEPEVIFTSPEYQVDHL